MATIGRFRIRTVLIVIGLVAILGAWPAAEWRAWSREQALLRRLQAKDAQIRVVGNGDRIRFGPRRYEIAFDEYIRLGPTSGSPDEPRPRALLLTAEDIRLMAELSDLETLDLHGEVLEPAAYEAIGELKQLKRLRISQGSWDDERLKHLETLVRLEELTLERTQTTDAGVERLQEKLPKLVIADD